MKKKIIIVVLLLLAIGAYLGSEVLFEGVTASLEVDPLYNALDVSLEVDENSGVIDFENSTIEIYKGEEKVDTLSLTEDVYSYRVEDLNLSTNYEVRLNLEYKIKFYLRTHTFTTSEEKLTKFVRDWSIDVESEGNATIDKVALLSDGSLISVIQNYGNEYSLELVKSSSDGEVIWNQTLKYGRRTYFGSIVEVGDGYIVTGEYLSTSGYEYFAIRLNADGEEVEYIDTGEWFVGSNVSGSFSSSFEGKLHKTTDGSFIFVSCWSDGLYFIKLDQDLAFVSRKKLKDYEYYVKGKSETDVQVTSSDDNSLIISTQKMVEDGQNNLNLIKVDLNGEVLWSTVSEAAGNSYVTALNVSDGSIVAVGNTESRDRDNAIVFESFVLKVDDQGDVLWRSDYADSGWDMFHDVVIEHDKIDVIGVSKDRSEYTGWIWRFDQEGTYIDSSKLGDAFMLKGVYHDGELYIGHHVGYRYTLEKY